MAAASLTINVVPAASGISSDGSFIGGSNGTSGKLVTSYGEWSFGAELAPEPTRFGGGPYMQVLLNGKLAAPTTGLPFAQQLRVDFGGNLYGLTYDLNWGAWDGYLWSGIIGGLNPFPPGHSGPTIHPPYGPVSPDGKTITGPSDQLITTDGVWTIDQTGIANLNGVQVQYGGGAPLPVSALQVNAHGCMFIATQAIQGPGGVPDGLWHLWANYEICPGTSASPPPGPVPINISFDPVRLTGSKSLPDGTVVATAAVTMSDGSAFSGSLSVSADANGNQTMVADGLQLRVSQPGWAASFGINSFVTVTAAQNGFSVQAFYGASITA